MKEHQQAVCDPQMQSCPSPGQCQFQGGGSDGAGAELPCSFSGRLGIHGLTVQGVTGTQSWDGNMSKHETKHGLKPLRSREQSKQQWAGSRTGGWRGLLPEQLMCIPFSRAGKQPGHPCCCSRHSHRAEEALLPSDAFLGRVPSKATGFLCSNSISYQKGFLDYFPANCKPLQQPKHHRRRLRDWL